jgi:hypothetical protein
MITVYEKDNTPIWDQVLQSIRPPPPEKTVFSNDAKLRLVIVEPRNHPWLQGVLRNVAHVYGGSSDVGLTIFHGTENETYIRQITDGWKGIEWVNLGKPNLTIYEYNQLLTSTAFYERFTNSEWILVFQTDTLLRRQIDRDFFQYDYVGAPWTGHPTVKCRCLVGNGGFSLRRVSTMLAICTLYSIPKPSREQNFSENEDVFFAEHMDPKCVPSREMAARFSVEHIYHPDPCGGHQVYRFFPKELVIEFLKGVPGVER